MRDISLHVMDVMENSLASGASRIDVELRVEGGRLHVEIRDDGRGMSPEDLERATDPFFTTKRGRRTGLGLALFAQAARESGGSFEVDSARGGGTSVRAVFVLGHPDCKPVGDTEKTVRLLRLAHPEVDIRYRADTSRGGGER
jgi:signal transduction histidine kinase